MSASWHHGRLRHEIAEENARAIAQAVEDDDEGDAYDVVDDGDDTGKFMWHLHT